MYIRVYMIHETADTVDSSLGLYVIMMSKTADYAGYSLDSRRLNGTFKDVLEDSPFGLNVMSQMPKMLSR